MKEYLRCAKEMLEFIENSPSCFHAVANVKKILKEQGFTELEEGQDWTVEAGGGYYVTRNDSSIIAFRLPGSGHHSGQGRGSRFSHYGGAQRFPFF